MNQINLHQSAEIRFHHYSFVGWNWCAAQFVQFLSWVNTTCRSLNVRNNKKQQTSSQKSRERKNLFNSFQFSQLFFHVSNRSLFSLQRAFSRTTSKRVCSLILRGWIQIVFRESPPFSSWVRIFSNRRHSCVTYFLSLLTTRRYWSKQSYQCLFGDDLESTACMCRLVNGKCFAIHAVNKNCANFFYNWVSCYNNNFQIITQIIDSLFP